MCIAKKTDRNQELRSKTQFRLSPSTILSVKVPSCLFALFGLLLAAKASPPPAADTVLWYTRPAQSWMTEALPLGNGSLGAMIFGLTDTERVQFNVNSLWTGNEHDTGYYQAFGDIFIQLNHANPTNYSRSLDIATAVQRVSYESGGIRYERAALISHPAKVMVIHLGADKPGGYTGRLWLTDMHNAKIVAEGNRITSAGHLDNGLQYEAQLVVLSSGGAVHVDNSLPPSGTNPLAGVPGAASQKLPAASIVFEKCNSLTLVLAADTNYVPDRSKNWRGPDPHDEITRRVDAVTPAAMQALYNAHVADYQSLFNRVRLDFGKTDPLVANKPTDERLLAYTKENTKDPQLEEMFAQYGRYLLISSSRNGLPANLQGLWNDSNRPPWRSDYHSNINIQMNYWLAEPMNLSELHLPFIHYVDSLLPVYRERSHEEYPKARGWTVRTENGIFGGGSFVWNTPGSAWYARHFWEHYAFTQDKAYLRDVAYPVLKEVCQFWEDTLVAQPDGTLVTPKGWSPEHGPTEPGVTYDQEIIYDLFTNYIQAADTLGVDKAYRDKIAEMRDKLLKPKVGRWGQLQEWETDRDDPKDTHRHVSHLYAVYPGCQITSQTPKLLEAAKVSLRARGDGGTGWSRAWKINFWARFHDGDHAYLMLRKLLHYTTQEHTDMNNEGGVYPNFFDAHPPFQIDGNFGASAGVAEMLLQSQEHFTDPAAPAQDRYIIDLLPALPSAWPDGTASGLCARGGIVVDIAWKGGKLDKAILHNRSGGVTRVRYAGREVDVKLGPGQSIVLNGALSVVGGTPGK